MPTKKVIAKKIPLTKNKKCIIAVSGGFDPIHVGHIRMIAEAKELAGPGGELVVIINNDHWLRAKKGFVFMPERERKEVVNSIKGVDRVVMTAHKKTSKDMSVCAELRKIKPDIFANGGDRTKKNIPELALEKEFNMKMVFGVGKGGKIQSSSWLVEKAKQGK